MSGNILKTRSNQTCFLLFVYILFLFLRAPDILIQGRFWAEEGNIFYANAYNMPLLHALFVVYGGYINLGASGATLLARYLYVPLEYAPYVTTFIGLFFQILPIYFLLTAKDEWLTPFRVRLLATLLLLFVPESSEISLQSLHIQFHLTLACTLIAFLKTDIRHQRWFKLVLLVFAPLCGLLPIVLLPIFFIQLVTEKNRFRLEQLIALMMGSVIQLSFYLYNLKYNIDLNSISIIRQHHMSLTELCSVLYVRDLVFPFLGHRYDVIAKIIAKIFYELKGHHIFILTCITACISLLILFTLLIKRTQLRKIFIICIITFFALFITVYMVIGETIQLNNPYFTNSYETCLVIMVNIFNKLDTHQISIKACVISGLFLLFTLCIFIRYPKTRRGFILFITAFFTLCLAIYGVIGGTIQLVNPYFTERYTFLSQALFSIMLLYFSITLPHKGKIISNVIIFWLLIVGCFNFFQLLPEAKDGGGHVWKQELQKWKENSEYHPKIWSNGWYIIIPKQITNHTK